MYIVKEAYITMPWLSIYLLEHYFKILNGKDINPHSWQVTPAVSTENFLDTVKQKYKLDFKQCGAFDVMVNLFIFKSLQNKKVSANDIDSLLAGSTREKNRRNTILAKFVKELKRRHGEK